jgi:hypothetical protein
MLIWDDAITICQDESQDSSATSLVTFKRYMNLGYKKILAQLGRPVTENTKTALTVASQAAYQVPPDFLFIKSITVTVGSTVYPLIEEESQENWDLLNMTVQTASIPEKFFVRPRFGYGGAEIALYPVPSTAGYTITMVYESTDRDLSRDKYITGTVALTGGSATVTGTGTTWISPMVGRYFSVNDEYGDGYWYRIVSRISNTSITLENVYEGETTSAKSYVIAEAFNLPEEMQDLPCHYALSRYYSGKQNSEKMSEHLAIFKAGLVDGKRTHGTKSRNSIIRDSWISRAPTYPYHFPRQITS